MIGGSSEAVMLIAHILIALACIAGFERPGSAAMWQ